MRSQVKRTGVLEGCLVGATAAAISADYTLWFLKSHPGALGSNLYGAAVAGLTLSFAGVVVWWLRGLRVEARSMFLARQAVLLKEIRGRGKPRPARGFYDSPQVTWEPSTGRTAQPTEPPPDTRTTPPTAVMTTPKTKGNKAKSSTSRKATLATSRKTATTGAARPRASSGRSSAAPK